MNIRIIGAGIVIVVLLVISFKVFVKKKNNGNGPEITQVWNNETLESRLYFNNGIEGDQNLQQHYRNFLDLTRANFEDPLLQNYALGYVHNALAEQYQAGYKFAHALHHDIYIGPENPASYEQLPQTQFFDIPRDKKVYVDFERAFREQSAGKQFFQDNSLYRRREFQPIFSALTPLHEYLAGGNTEKGYEYISENQVLVNDSTSGLFLINTEFLRVLANDSYKKAKEHFTSFIAGASSNPKFKYSARLKLLLLEFREDADNPDFHEINKPQYVLPSLPDSVVYPEYQLDILRLLPYLQSGDFISDTQVTEILSKIEFPHQRLLFHLLSYAEGFEQPALKEYDLIQFVNLEFTRFSAPQLTPVFVLTLSEYFYENQNYDNATQLISDFWYKNSRAHPPEFWWFDNYPTILIRSYRIGRWNGGRLPLWLGDFIRVAEDDPAMQMLAELCQFYNQIVFHETSSPLRGNS